MLRLLTQIVSNVDLDDVGPQRLSYNAYNNDLEAGYPDHTLERQTSRKDTGIAYPDTACDEKASEAQKQPEIIVVDWDGDDKELGTSWSILYRSYLTLFIGLTTISSTMASSLPSMVIPQVSQTFHVSTEVTKLTVFIFVGGYCLGPLGWAPMSELYGVRPTLLLSLVGSTIFNMACALSPNIGGLIIFRFLAGSFSSATLVVGGGIQANIWNKDWLGVGMSVFSMAPMCGPTLGPVLGGWIAVSGTTWRWVYWASTIFAGFLVALGLFTMKETNPNLTLRKKAQRLRETAENDRYKAPIELRKIELRELCTRWLILPISMLIFEPMLQAITIYMSFVYGVLYLFFEAFPVVFALHKFNELQIGLAFLGFLLGCLLAGAYNIFCENARYVKAIKASPDGTVPPEERIRLTMIGSPLLTISLFWFAWSSYETVSYWSAIGAATVYGIAMFFIFVRKKPGATDNQFSLMTFMADAYQQQTACALSANTVVRSSFGFGFPLVRFKSLTYQVCNTNVQ